MPIASLMVAHNAISNLNYSESDFAEDPRPLDFTMSKFKSTSPAKHPLYDQFFGNHQNHPSLKLNSDSSTNRDIKEEQGEFIKFILDTSSKSIHSFNFKLFLLSLIA